jgi:hypothetical protein
MLKRLKRRNANFKKEAGVPRFSVWLIGGIIAAELTLASNAKTAYVPDEYTIYL